MRTLAFASAALLAACSSGASGIDAGPSDTGCWMTASEAAGWTLPCELQALGPEDGGFRVAAADLARKNASVSLLVTRPPPTAFDMATLAPGSGVTVVAYQSIYLAYKSGDGGVSGTISGALDDAGHGSISAECPLDSPGGGANSGSTLHLDVTF